MGFSINFPSFFHCFKELSLAAIRGEEEMVQVLLMSWAEPNAADCLGVTALYQATWETLGKSWDNPWENGENHGKSIGTCYFNPENMVISWDLEPIHRLLSGFFSEIHSKWGIYRDLFTDL